MKVLHGSPQERLAALSSWCGYTRDRNFMANTLNKAIKEVRRELRWPASLTIIVICGLYFILPERLTVGPNWLLPALVALLLIPTILFHRIGRQKLNVVFGVTLLTTITLALATSLGFLIVSLPGKHFPPEDLLRAAVALWLGNVLVFASWYWRLDAGGPYARESRGPTRSAFLFPQMALPESSKYADPAWRPQFVDYLFLAFNTSTAFSPTDAAYFLRMVPSSAWAGFVAPMSLRKAATASSFSRMAATMGPLLINSVNSP